MVGDGSTPGPKGCPVFKRTGPRPGPPSGGGSTGQPGAGRFGSGWSRACASPALSAAGATKPPHRPAAPTGMRACPPPTSGGASARPRGMS